eukprot:686916-Rhodomonas_salina.1
MLRPGGREKFGELGMGVDSAICLRARYAMPGTDTACSCYQGGVVELMAKMERLPTFLAPSLSTYLLHTGSLAASLPPSLFPSLADTDPHAAEFCASHCPNQVLPCTDATESRITHGVGEQGAGASGEGTSLLLCYRPPGPPRYLSPYLSP